MKRVLDVGQCNPDHSSISRMLTQHFNVEIGRAHLPTDALEQLRETSFDLVLINRKLDADYSNGMAILQSMKQDPQLESIPVMLVSNYDDAQDAAEAAGAIRGFGKARLSDPQTIARLAAVLE